AQGASAMTTDGTNFFFFGNSKAHVLPSDGSFNFPSKANVYDAVYDGQAVWVSVSDLNKVGYLVRGVYTAGKSPTMTFTAQSIGPILKRLAFDGRYIWGAAAGNLYKFDGATQVATYPLNTIEDPSSITFDGYELW